MTEGTGVFYTEQVMILYMNHTPRWILLFVVRIFPNSLFIHYVKFMQQLILARIYSRNTSKMNAR